MTSKANYTSLRNTHSSSSTTTTVKPIVPDILASTEPWPCIIFDVIAFPSSLTGTFVEKLIYMIRRNTNVRVFPSFRAMSDSRTIVPGNVVVFLEPETHLTVDNTSAAGRLVLHLAAIGLLGKEERAVPVALVTRAPSGLGWVLLEYKDWRGLSKKKSRGVEVEG